MSSTPMPTDPLVSIVLTVPAGMGGELARSALSVARQSMGSWRLFIVHRDSADLRAAADVLAADDPRVTGAASESAALAAPPGTGWWAFLEAGSRWPTDYLARVSASVGATGGGPAVLVADLVVEHGYRLTQRRSVVPNPDDPRSWLASQVAVRDEPLRLGGSWLGAARVGPVARLAGEPIVTSLSLPEPTAVPEQAVVVEVGDASPPLGVKPQLTGLVAAGLPVTLCLAGPSRAAAGAALRRWATTLGIRVVSARTPALARARAVQMVAEPVVTFLPGGWELPPSDLARLALRLVDPGVAAVIPAALDDRGAVLGLGMVWADVRTPPGRFLRGHPVADAPSAPFAVPGPASEGLTVRVAEVRAAIAAADAPAPWWAVDLLRRAGVQGEVVVDPGVRLALTRLAPPHAGDPVQLPGRGKARSRVAARAERWGGPGSVVASRELHESVGFPTVGVRDDGTRWHPVVSRGARTVPPPRRWALKIAAPGGSRGDTWGDVFFADDLAEALRRAGQEVVIDRQGEWPRQGDRPREAEYLDQVLLNIRGWSAVPRRPGTVSLMWIISHPDEVTAQEAAQCDAVFAASRPWAEKATRRFGVPVEPLLQATNPHRFHPGVAPPDTGPNLLFVGNSRNVFRPIVADARSAGLRPTVIGDHWDKFLPREEVAARSIANADLPAAYRGAGIVLNDHWGDMAREGFLNNRLFDGVAAGARVVSDDAAGMAEVFGDAVAVYRAPADLARLCDPALRTELWPPDRVAADSRRIREEHSFDARAKVLIEVAERFPTLSG